MVLSYADPQVAHYRLLELQADAASTRPERQHPPDKARPAPPRVAVFRERRASMGQIALETVRP
jgi:hypothetical protein